MGALKTIIDLGALGISLYGLGTGIQAYRKDDKNEAAMRIFGGAASGALVHITNNILSKNIGYSYGRPNRAMKRQAYSHEPNRVGNFKRRRNRTSMALLEINEAGNTANRSNVGGEGLFIDEPVDAWLNQKPSDLFTTENLRTTRTGLFDQIR